MNPERDKLIQLPNIRFHRHRNHGDLNDMIAIFLSDGPKKLVELEQQFIALSRRFGFFVELIDQESIDRGEMKQILIRDLDAMEKAGWQFNRSQPQMNPHGDL